MFQLSAVIQGHCSVWVSEERFQKAKFSAFGGKTPFCLRQTENTSCANDECVGTLPYASKTGCSFKDFTTASPAEEKPPLQEKSSKAEGTKRSRGGGNVAPSASGGEVRDGPSRAGSRAGPRGWQSPSGGRRPATAVHGTAAPRGLPGSPRGAPRGWLAGRAPSPCFQKLQRRRGLMSPFGSAQTPRISLS